MRLPGVSGAVVGIDLDVAIGQVAGPDGGLARADADIDADFNGKADQYRWFHTAGSRWALDTNEDGQIDGWKTISAEEVTADRDIPPLANSAMDGYAVSTADFAGQGPWRLAVCDRIASRIGSISGTCRARSTMSAALR